MSRQLSRISSLRRHGRGMDTLGISLLVGPGTAERLAGTLIRSTRREMSGAERSRAYGALRLSTVPLFPTDRVEGARFCIEFSAPRVLFGENASSVSALGVRVASHFVLDEVEARFGIALHDQVFTVFRFDVDANPVSAGRFGVRAIPTMILFKDGREAQRLVGYMPKERLLETIGQHLTAA